jgi:hypothetical protein
MTNSKILMNYPSCKYWNSSKVPNISAEVSSPGSSISPGVCLVHSLTQMCPAAGEATYVAGVSVPIASVLVL